MTVAVREFTSPLTGRTLRFAYEPGTPDEAVLDEVLIHDVYRLRHDDVRAEIAGRVVVDVGAHIGTFTVAALDAGAAHVVAIEPNPQTRVLLATNVAPFAGQVTIVPAAVGNPRAMVRAVTRGESATAHVVAAEPGQNLYVPVLDFGTVVSVAREWIPAGERIALMKVDCEGAEYGWFDTASPDLVSQVNRIFMEWHGPTIAAHLDHDDLAYGRLLTRLAETHSVSVFGRPADGGLLYAHPYR